MLLRIGLGIARRAICPAVAASGGRAAPARAPEASLCLPSLRMGQPSTSLAVQQLRLGARTPRRRSITSRELQRAGPVAADGSGSSDDYTEEEDGDAAGAAAAAGTTATSAGTRAAVPHGATNGALPMAAAAAAAAAAGGATRAGAVAGGGGTSGAAVLASSDDEGRWHDAMHRAIIESLQPPRSEHPSWWGKRFHGLQRRMAEVLESREGHYIVIGMVLLDLAIVLTELVLSSFYPSPELAPHIVHVAEEALSYTSIGILAIFNAELLAKLLVFGFKYFTHSNWHMFDAVVVVTSFTLELSLRGVAQEVASLLIFFRLWRIMRIMHGVAEAMELNHSQELSRLQLRNQQLESELSVSQQRLLEMNQQVALLNVAAAAKGLDLHYILSTAASTQQQLANTAQQQLLAAAAATASKGMELQTILAAAAAQQQQVAASAQQQLLAAAAAAAAGQGGAVPAAGSTAGSVPQLVGGDAAAAAVAAALAHSHNLDGHSHRSSSSSSSSGNGGTHGFEPADHGSNSSGSGPYSHPIEEQG